MFKDVGMSHKLPRLFGPVFSQSQSSDVLAQIVAVFSLNSWDLHGELNASQFMRGPLGIGLS